MEEIWKANELKLLFPCRAESADELTDRQQRLATIRRLFLQVFFKAVDFNNKFEGGSGLSSILDQVTEKIREGWGTVVWTLKFNYT